MMCHLAIGCEDCVARARPISPMVLHGGLRKQSVKIVMGVPILGSCVKDYVMTNFLMVFPFLVGKWRKKWGWCQTCFWGGCHFELPIPIGAPTDNFSSPKKESKWPCNIRKPTQIVKVSSRFVEGHIFVLQWAWPCFKTTRIFSLECSLARWLSCWPEGTW